MSVDDEEFFMSIGDLSAFKTLFVFGSYVIGAKAFFRTPEDAFLLQEISPNHACCVENDDFHVDITLILGVHGFNLPARNHRRRAIANQEFSS